MAAATRLESLLSLLVSPQKDAEAEGRVEDRRTLDLATDGATAKNSLHVHTQNAGQRHDEPAGVQAIIKRQRSGVTGDTGAGCPHSQPFTQKDQNAGLAAAPDLLGGGGGANTACTAANADQLQRAELATEQPVALHGAAVTCRELIVAATPRPRDPDARAIPTARHRAPAGLQLHTDSSGSGEETLGAVGADAMPAVTSPGERRRWELRLSAATQRAQVAFMPASNILPQHPGLDLKTTWLCSGCLPSETASALDFDIADIMAYIGCRLQKRMLLRRALVYDRSDGCHRINFSSVSMLQVAEAACAEARRQACAAAAGQRRLADELAAAQAAQQQAAAELKLLQAALEEVSACQTAPCILIETTMLKVLHMS